MNIQEFLSNQHIDRIVLHQQRTNRLWSIWVYGGLPDEASNVLRYGDGKRLTFLTANAARAWLQMYGFIGTIEEDRTEPKVILTDDRRIIDPPELPGPSVTWREAMALFEAEASIREQLTDSPPLFMRHG